MSKVPFSYSNGNIIAILRGKAHNIAQSHPYRKDIIKLLSKDNSETEILDLLAKQPEVAKPKVKAPVADCVRDEVEVKNGQVLYEGKPVHNAVATRILDFLREGLPIECMKKFLAKLMNNPSSKSVDDLYDFLEHRGLPITEDGDFLAYKAVNDNWYDKYTGTIRNAPGDVVEMKRNLVDDNHDRHCSKGLHCGAMDYVTTYGGGNDRIVIVKVNPADAVSVPRDASFMKLRVCRYEVVKEYAGDMLRPLYTVEGDEYYDDDYEPEYEDDSFDEDRWVEEFRSQEGADDDSFDEGDVTSTPAKSVSDVKTSTVYGEKPTGERFWNLRNALGRFTKKR